MKKYKFSIMIEVVILKFIFFCSICLCSIILVQSFTSNIYGEKDNSNASFNFFGNLRYKSGDNLTEYERGRCKLDLYLPANKKNFPVIVWFHGGSLKRGSKNDELTINIAKKFAKAGAGFAIVNYRLSPKVKYPAYIDDAAASVAWIKANISNYRGDGKHVFICGHSAGGYLAYMLAMNPEYLKKYNVNNIDIAGIVSIAGQTFTHYAIREERGIPNAKITPIIDKASPCYYAKQNTCPILAICADGDSPDRNEENKYLLALLTTLGNKNHKYIELSDRTHWSLIKKLLNENDQLFMEIMSFLKKNMQKAI